MADKHDDDAAETPSASPMPPIERPSCSADSCAEKAFSRFGHGEPGSDAQLLCLEHTLNAVRVAAARHELLDIVTHPEP